MTGSAEQEGVMEDRAAEERDDGVDVDVGADGPRALVVEEDHAHAALVPPSAVDTVRDSASAGLGAAGNAGADAPRILDTIGSAVTDGFHLAMWVSTAVLIVGALIVLTRTPRASATTTDANPSTASTLDDQTAGVASRGGSIGPTPARR